MYISRFIAKLKIVCTCVYLYYWQNIIWIALSFRNLHFINGLPVCNIQSMCVTAKLSIIKTRPVICKMVLQNPFYGNHIKFNILVMSLLNDSVIRAISLSRTLYRGVHWESQGLMKPCQCFMLFLHRRVHALARIMYGCMLVHDLQPFDLQFSLMVGRYVVIQLVVYTCGSCYIEDCVGYHGY